jgi:hypothetical protein
MKSVICVYDGMDGKHSNRLTIGKIYEVLEFKIDPLERHFIIITDNVGDRTNYFMISDDKVWFEDATPYIREETLNKLGI